MLKKRFRVKKSIEIEAIIRTHKVARDRYFKVYKKENHDQPHFRFAVSVPKKYGKAYERNKIKRQIRMIVSHQHIIKTDDFFIIVNPEAKTLSYENIERALCALLGKLKLIEVQL